MTRAQTKRGTTAPASVSPQHSLHATQADAVAPGQTPLRRTRMAVVEHLLDDLLAEAVDQPPARARQGWGSLVTTVDFDSRDRLGGLQNHRAYLGVRETSPQVHPIYLRKQESKGSRLSESHEFNPTPRRERLCLCVMEALGMLRAVSDDLSGLDELPESP
jgi:hypothetical protein